MIRKSNAGVMSQDCGLCKEDNKKFPPDSTDVLEFEYRSVLGDPVG